MNRTIRRAEQFRSPAQHLRYSAQTKHLSAPRIVVMRNAASEPMEALWRWVLTQGDPAAPAMSAQMLVELCGLWLGLTRGLHLNGTPFPRSQETGGNNILSRMYAGASMGVCELTAMHHLTAQLINAAMQVKGWEVWAEAATDLAIKNEFAKRQSDDWWIGGWKHKELK